MRTFRTELHGRLIGRHGLGRSADGWPRSISRKPFAGWTPMRRAIELNEEQARPRHVDLKVIAPSASQPDLSGGYL